MLRHMTNESLCIHYKLLRFYKSYENTEGILVEHLDWFKNITYIYNILHIIYLHIFYEINY